MKWITSMLRKDKNIEWTPEAKKSFADIKKAILEALVLVSPDFSKDFLIFSFTSEHTIVGVLLQKNQEGNEQPIAFYRKNLRDTPLKYNIMEKQAYALVQALKEFRVYILHSHTIAHVPTSAVKDILMQPDPEGKRGKWIAILLEYDLEIKSTKLIKGQGLAKLMAQSNNDTHSIDMIAHLIDEEQDTGGRSIPRVAENLLTSPWYHDIIHVLENLQARQGTERMKTRFLKQKAEKLCIINCGLYWKEPGGILLSLVEEEEAKRLMKEFHAGDYGGHQYWKATVNKILRVGFYWPTIFTDTRKEVATCHTCQIFEGKGKLLSLPLKPVQVEAPFQQWGLDFIREINPSSSGQHRWILTATDYFTKWIEAMPT